MEEGHVSAILQAASSFPLPSKLKFSYGTAGFRADASFMSSTVFRVGILASLRSLDTQSTIGLMITASHNKISDNGVKLVDPDGGMMTKDWEPFADALANAPDEKHLFELIVSFMKDRCMPFQQGSYAQVFLGRDTRPSGDILLEAAKRGITTIPGSVPIDMGVLTTPQLHWIIRCRNKGLEASEFAYFMQLSKSYNNLLLLILGEKEMPTQDAELIVDGANGIGGRKLQELRKLLKGVRVTVRNSGKEGEGILNEGVGADYVQKEKLVPSGFGPGDTGKRCASLDGDGDRLVYFYLPTMDAKTIVLVDGDKILSLFALFIREQLELLDVKGHSITLGAVQTAYANGASTDYLRKMGIEVSFTPTGVKYLHKRASEYDVGIYFEANGHGTVLFSEKFLCWLSKHVDKLTKSSAGSEKGKAALRLLEMSKLVNQAIGDALSGLLLVEAILQYYQWCIVRWSQLYQDLPSKQIKVNVADRSAITTANAERVVVNPAGLQEAIDIEVTKYQQARAFIRPSGTEDVVRVYAEASTEEAAESLACIIVQHMHQFLR